MEEEEVRERELPTLVANVLSIHTPSPLSSRISLSTNYHPLIHFFALDCFFTTAVHLSLDDSESVEKGEEAVTDSAEFDALLLVAATAFSSTGARGAGNEGSRLL
jgi:hypothetical protein